MKIRYKRSEDFFKNLLKERVVKIPEIVQVQEVKSDSFEQDGRRVYYAHLYVYSKAEYEALKELGLEDNVTTFKIKLKGYRGEDIAYLENQTLNLTEEVYTLDFAYEKKRCVGFDLVLPISEVI